MFTKPAAGGANTVGTPGVGRGRALRSPSQSGAGSARDVRRAAGRVPGRGDRDARRGSGAGHDHGRRKPGALDAQRRPPRPRARVTRLHGERRHLSQRDDATRQRDPAAGRRARPRPLRPRVVQLLGPQRRELLAAGGRPRAGRDGRVGDPPAPRRDRRRARARRPTPPRSTTWSSPGSCRRRCSAPAPTSRAATPTSCSTALSSRRGPERILDLMLRSGPYGDGFGADPSGLSLEVLEAGAARRRPRPAAAAHPRGVAHRERQDRARPGADRRRRRPPARARSTRVATARWCSSDGVTSARTTRGCTTSTCS